MSGLFFSLSVIGLIGCVVLTRWTRHYRVAPRCRPLEDALWVCIDIGGHRGQTSLPALRSGLFQRLHVFEPVPELADVISRRLSVLGKTTTDWTVHAKALGAGDGEALLYMPGTQSGTTYGNRWDEEPESITVPKCDAGRWFKEHLPEEARIFLKINCEGGEVEILDSLAKSNQLKRITLLMVDFDVRRLFGRPDERERLLKLLQDHQVDVIDPRYVERWPLETNYLGGLRARKWLREIAKRYRPASD
jgi:FkbM family methyltransferase